MELRAGGGMRHLSTAQHDRAAGVILGQACGDALGVPYEFERPPGSGELAEMKGGGLGDFEPGEWSDDTSMAVPIAEVAASGADLTSTEALDAIAQGFVRWYDESPADIGIQTRAVLSRTSRRLRSGERGAGRIATEEAAMYAAQHAHSAGNGALMRTSPVALAHMEDRQRCAAAARAVASLTHADPLAGDSCVLWVEAIRVAVLDGRFELTGGLDLVPDDRREQWRQWVEEAERRQPVSFTPNGFTVAALQAAWSAIRHTPVPPEEPAKGRFACLHLQHALQAAIRIGNDTDTVAAIAGGLLGARWGASAIPWRWRRAVHGWPGKNGRDLVTLATLAVAGGHDDDKGWPSCDRVDYTEQAFSKVVPHPHDPGVLLGTYRTVDHDATAVVSACRVGRHQRCFGNAEVFVESRLMDSDDPAKNRNLGFTLYDAADAVRGLRAEGHVVLLHCVAAQQRTPSIAVAYSRLLSIDAEKARTDVRAALTNARARGALWEAAARVAASAE